MARTKEKAGVEAMPTAPKSKGEITVIQPTPMRMVELAVSQNADVEKLSKLLDLEQRWRADEAKRAFTAALAEFKREPPTIVRTKKAGFDSRRTGEKVGYSYAPLAEVCAVIAPALSKHALSHTWAIKQASNRIEVTCILTHALGHSESVSMNAEADTTGAKNSIQAIGSTVSYLERYTLLAATGLASGDQDDDGSGGEPRPTRQAEAPVGPHVVPLRRLPDGTPLYAGFGEELISRVAMATAVTDIDAMQVANRETFRSCEANAPTVYKDIGKAIKAAKKRLATPITERAAPPVEQPGGSDQATPTVQPMEEAARAATEAVSSVDALAALSPFNPKAKDKTDAGWKTWASAFAAELPNAKEPAALVKRFKRELDYVRAYLVTECDWSGVDMAIKAATKG